MGRRNLIIVIALAVASLTGTLPARCADLKEVMAGKKIPFVLLLKDLGDGWRRVAPGHIKTNGSAAADPIADFYYTKGETISVGSELFLAAYRPKIEPGSSEVLTPETPVTLSLLNLSVIGSLDNIRPFNLAQELEESKARDDALRQSGPASQPGAASKEPASTLGNLKQLGLALLMYADDWEEILPPQADSASLQKALRPYLRDDSFFLDPTTGSPYNFNSWLAGRGVNEIPQPEKTVTFFASTTTKTGVIVATAFVDGHTKFLDEPGWQEVKQISHLP